MSETGGVNRKGSSLGRRKDGGKRWMIERDSGRGVGLEQTKRECLDKVLQPWTLFWGSS